MQCWLWGFWGVEGLDTRICWENRGNYFRVLDHVHDRGREDAIKRARYGTRERVPFRGWGNMEKPGAKAP